MGEITVNVTLENPNDRAVFERGYSEESAIRRSSLDAIVDTGGVMLVLPQVETQMREWYGFRQRPAGGRPVTGIRGPRDVRGGWVRHHL